MNAANYHRPNIWFGPSTLHSEVTVTKMAKRDSSLSSIAQANSYSLCDLGASYLICLNFTVFMHKPGIVSTHSMEYPGDKMRYKAVHVLFGIP